MAAAVEWLNKSLKEIGHEIFHGVHKVLHGETKPMADGQLIIISDINRITLTLETTNGKKKEIKAIAKMEAQTGPGRDLATSCNAFNTEIKMYSDVLKKMEILMLEVGDKETIWPVCYHCGDNKLLIEDLSEIGYRVVPTHQFLDLEHALLVMKSIGKFHALTLAMNERSLLEINEEESVPYYARKLHFMDAMQLQSLNSLCKSIRKDWGPEWASLPDKLLKYLEKPGEKLHNVWKSSKGKWDVLNHGDFSMRNMLFHYPPGSSHPDAIKFVDFQMSHYGNPANDLVTLLFSSMRPRIREENMDLLLGTYINSLTTTAAKHSYKKPLPTIQDIKDSIYSLHPLIFVTWLFTIPFFIMSGKQDMQKKANEYFEKFDTVEAVADAHGKEAEKELAVNFSDEEVADCFKFEFQLFINKKIF